jgi:hypothetical protein
MVSQYRNFITDSRTFKVDFIYNYEEIGNQIYGVAVYSNNELSEIYLEEEDFEQYDYHEETDTYF